jgi:hypothetical protein
MVAKGQVKNKLCASGWGLYPGVNAPIDGACPAEATAGSYSETNGGGTRMRMIEFRAAGIASARAAAEAAAGLAATAFNAADAVARPRTTPVSASVRGRDRVTR